MPAVNPIKTVDGVAVKCPSSYTYRLQDISAPGAGRTEDTEMQKMRIGQAVKIDLVWNAVTTAELSAILTAFNPEYITVEYLDGLAGGFQTTEFYVGDRASPMYNAAKGLWENVTFNIIERSGV